MFIEKNYISITKYEIAVWEEITMELREFIRSHIEDGKPIVELDSNDIISHSEDQKTKEFDKLDDISKEIINIVLSHNEKNNGEEIQILLDEEAREKCIVFSTNEKEYEKYTTKISCDENFVVYFYL